MRFFHRFSFVITFALLASAGVQSARAQDDDRARARQAFERGVNAYEAERWEEALASFQEAYRIAPHPSVRVNMANAYLHLGRPVEAIDHFQRFLLEMGDEGDPVQKREVRRQIEELRAQIGEVFIRVEPEGATVTLDGHTTRRAPILDALELAAGTHHVEVAMDGYRTHGEDFVVSGGERHEVRVELEAGAEPAGLATDPGGAPRATSGDMTGGGSVAAPSADEPSGGGLPATVWIAGGATVALGVAAAVMGVLAVSAESDFDGAVARSNDPSLSPAERNQAVQDGLDDADRADRRALTADILGIAALVGAGATVLFYFLGSKDDGDDAVAVTPTAGPNGGGMVVRGSF